MEQGTKSAKAKVEARPTVIRKSRKIDGSTGPQLKQRLAEALEQHAAVSEILRVISASPSDVQPVLNAVADRALKLCDAADATIFLVEGDKLRTAARFGSMRVYSPLGSFMPLTRAPSPVAPLSTARQLTWRTWRRRRKRSSRLRANCRGELVTARSYQYR